MNICKDCYHLIKKDDGTDFCLAEGFNSSNNSKLEHCPYFINKNEPLKPCPDCKDVHRIQSDFCKNCKIIDQLKIQEQFYEKNEKIGKYSLNEMEDMNNEINFIENLISTDIHDITHKIRLNLKEGPKHPLYYIKLKEEIDLLEKEILLTKELVILDELINKVILILNKIIQKQKENNKPEFNDEIDLLKIENKLSMEIIKLEAKMHELLDSSKLEESDKILNDLKEIFNHLKKLENISEVKEIKKKFMDFRNNIVKI